MTVIAVLNEKGGVGKTTIATNLSRGFQLAGETVILIDSDPQGSARDWYAAAGEDNALLHSLMRRAVFLVYPSLYEGFGIPVLEAMRLGCEATAVDINLGWGPIQGNQEVYADATVLENNKYLPLIQEIAKSALAPLPSPNYGEVVDLLQAEIHSALSGSKTAQQALDDACAAIDVIDAE